MKRQTAIFGPIATEKDAISRAQEVADWRQEPTTVWRTKEFGSYFVAAKGAPLGRDDAVVIADREPRPGVAPFHRWELVDMGAMTDRTLRDLKVEDWRHRNREVTSKGALMFGIRSFEASFRRFGKKIPLFGYIVRRNPKAPR